MKLLLDENLSHRIIPALQNSYSGSSQVALLKMNNANDMDIWIYGNMQKMKALQSLLKMPTSMSLAY